jgi:LacI family transcriptional regulator
MARKRVTQADVALKAGVSQTAVSQILGNMSRESNFRSETREKVMQAARELGYVPNIAARTLRTNRTTTIGVVMGFITDELGIRVIHGIQEVTHERGYALLIADTEQDADRKREVLEQFRQREVDGLIIVDSWTGPDIDLDDENYPPTISVHLRENITQHNCVGMDNFRGGYEATRHLLDRGYRKVACIAGPENWPASAERIRGYQKALEEYQFSYDPTLVEYGDWEILAGITATNLLLDRHSDIDAIFVLNDLMAVGSIKAAAPRGLLIPQDIALVGYDDRYLNEAISPPLTSFAIPLNQMGQKAAHLMIDGLLRKNTRRVPSINVAGNLVVRASCGALSPTR